MQGLTYALYLSFMRFGGVVSGLLASAAVSALGIVPFSRRQRSADADDAAQRAVRPYRSCRLDSQEASL